MKNARDDPIEFAILLPFSSYGTACCRESTAIRSIGFDGE